MKIEELEFDSEAIIECIDHIESATALLQKINLEESFDQVYDPVFRALHSVKGLLGMVKRDEIAAEVHDLETIIVSLKGKQLTSLQLDILFSMFDLVLTYLEGKTKENLTIKNIWLNGFAPIKGELSENISKSCPLIVCMSSIPLRFKKILTENKIEYIHCKTAEELYSLKEKALVAENFIFSPIVDNHDCSLIVRVINGMVPNAHCAVLIDENSHLPHDSYSDEVSFSVYGVNSKLFESNILKIISK